MPEGGGIAFKMKIKSKFNFLFILFDFFLLFLSHFSSSLASRIDTHQNEPQRLVQFIENGNEILSESVKSGILYLN